MVLAKVWDNYCLFLPNNYFSRLSSTKKIGSDAMMQNINNHSFDETVHSLFSSVKWDQGLFSEYSVVIDILAKDNEWLSQLHLNTRRKRIMLFHGFTRMMHISMSGVTILMGRLRSPVKSISHSASFNSISESYFPVKRIPVELDWFIACAALSVLDWSIVHGEKTLNAWSKQSRNDCILFLLTLESCDSILLLFLSGSLFEKEFSENFFHFFSEETGNHRHSRRTKFCHQNNA